VGENLDTEWNDVITFEMCETMTGEIDIAMRALRRGLRKLLKL